MFLLHEGGMAPFFLLQTLCSVVGVLVYSAHHHCRVWYGHLHSNETHSASKERKYNYARDIQW